MERYLCIHGHFYQPSRENPWLNAIDIQTGAFPYHDWNEKINTECYMVNTGANILNASGKIAEIFNNYSRMSFNFGPSLLSWIKNYDRDTYDSIIEADSSGMKRFSGHGCAIAQIYNHIIMPLAPATDRFIQVKWAISDFTANFKRQPEGMWLSETAVDSYTLEILADCGIKFTILSPHQAHSIRKISARGAWADVSGGKINTRMPYLCRLAGGKVITIFFYDDVLSNMVAFGNLLDNGEAFAAKITGLPKTGQELPEIISIASDGETYGHHHRFGEMALAYCLKNMESKDNCKLTVFGQYLEKYPPVYEVKIIENSSWSCSHGIDRWKNDCGCNTGEKRPSCKWNQKWRKPLRDAINWLEDKNSSIFNSKLGFTEKAGGSGQNTASAVNENAAAVLESYFNFLNDTDLGTDILSKYNKHIAPALKNRDKEATAAGAGIILGLLEAYRNSMLMQSSDGWFFDDISGPETLQVLRYASRTIGLLEDISGESIEPVFLSILRRARSNKKDMGNGEDIYLKYASAASFNEEKACGMLAFKLLFEKEKEKERPPVKISIYSFAAEEIIFRRKSARDCLSVSGSSIIGFKNLTAKKNIKFEASINMQNGIYDISSAEVKIITERPGKNMAPEKNPIVYKLSDYSYDFQAKIQEKMLTPYFEKILMAASALKKACCTKTAESADKEIFKYLFSGTLPLIFESAEIISLLEILDNGHRAGAGLDFAAGAKLEKLASELVRDFKNTEILKQMIFLIEIMDKIKIPLNLWRTRKIIFNTLKSTEKFFHTTAPAMADAGIQKQDLKKDIPEDHLNRLLYYLNLQYKN